MKNKSCLLRFTLICISFFTSCSSYKTLSPAEFLQRTDYVMGQEYHLKKYVFLFSYDKDDPNKIPVLQALGTNGTSVDLNEFIRKAPADNQVAGLMQPGDRLRVIRFDESKSSTIGNFLHVFAEVTTGDCVGKIVKVSLISRDKTIGYSVFIDPEFLEPIK